MLNAFSLFVGLRFTRAKKRSQFLSFVSLISLFGMILGVMSLIVVLSVMNGFEAELRKRVLGVLPHGFVESSISESFENWQALADKVESHTQILASAPFIGGPAMLSMPGMVRGVQLSAILPEQENKVSIVGDFMVKGSLQDLKSGEYGIVLGGILARNLGLALGESVSVVIPKVSVTPLGIFPRLKRFTVVGTFEVGSQLDSTSVFIHLDDGAKLYITGSNVHGLRLKTTDLYRTNLVMQELNNMFANNQQTKDLHAKDWSQSQGSLFQAVKMEKTMMSILLTMVIAVAAFNIVSILTMVVTDKQSDIAVLRTMGASPSTIMGIFIIQGMAIGILGLLIGMILGITLALNIGSVVALFENIFQSYIFDPSVYFITTIPSVLEWQDIATIACSALLLSLLATLYPSYYASKVHPARALSYE